MLSDEEKKVIEIQDSISILENTDLDMNNIYSIDLRTYNVAVKTVLNLVKKQSKEIEELNKENTRQHELIGNIHQKWEYKIKAKVKEIKDRPVQDEFITATQGKLNTIIDMESLLEKE